MAQGCKKTQKDKMLCRMLPIPTWVGNGARVQKNTKDKMLCRMLPIPTWVGNGAGVQKNTKG